MGIKAQSSAHTKWLCKYHIVFSPKYRRKVIFNNIRSSIGEILRDLCKYKGVEITLELLLRDATNTIYGTFVDAEQQYNKTDFEPVVIDEWIEEDGLEIKENMD